MDRTPATTRPMSSRDIDLALALIDERLPHLRQPRRVDRCGFPAAHRCLGQFRLLSDTLKLNARYLAPLDDSVALDLLDTLLHELLHKHSGLLRQLRDTFRRHPDVCDEAARLTRLLADDYAKRRRDVAQACANATKA